MTGLRLALSLDDGGEEEESDKDDDDDDGTVTLTTVTLDREAVPVPMTLVGRHSYNPASSSLTQRILNVDRRLNSINFSAVRLMIIDTPGSVLTFSF